MSGLLLTIYDGRGRVVHRAAGNTVVALAPGLYRIRGERQGRIEERIVEHPESGVVVAPAPPWISAAPLEIEAPAAPSASGVTAASIKNTARRPLGSGAPPESRLVVFVRSAGRRPPGQRRSLGDGLSIRDASGASLGTFAAEEILHAPDGGWIAFAAPAAPGFYVLHHAGDPARDVALQLHRGFATQVFVFDDGRPRTDTMKAFLAPLGQPFRPSDPVAFAVDAGLWMLEGGRGDPPDALAAVLDRGQFDNPMLGLVAAHLVLRGPRPDSGLVRDILDELDALLPGAPDVHALRVRAALSCGHDLPRAPATSPPMLRAGLAALVEATCLAPEIIAPGSLVEHASVALLTDSPYSNWEPRAPEATRAAGALEAWVLAGVKDATARGGADARTLARDLAVPLRVVERAIGEIGRTRREPPPLPDAAGPDRAIVLEVIAGPMSGRRFIFAQRDTVLVGRDPECQIVLSEEDDTASRYHAVIVLDPPEVSVRDLGSRNGTFVNLVKRGGREADEAPEDAKRRQEDIPLAPGDRVDMGRTALVIRTQPLSPLAAQEPASEAAPHSLAPFSIAPTSKVGGPLPEIPGYEALRMLGKGGMGAVYLGRRRRDRELVAIKTMLPRGTTSERASLVFRREVESMIALSPHPGMVRVLEDGIGEGGFWFVMELCRGGSVTDHLARKGGRLPPGEAVSIIQGALSGLAYAHRRGFVHRDLKPGNILLGDRSGGLVKIGDFGLAKSFLLAGLSKMTETGEWEGTTAFMPREQVVNFRHAKPPTDVWAMAATLYFMITGLPPRDVSPGQDPIEAVLQNPIVPVRTRDPAIPAKLAAVLDRALQGEVAKRPADAAELARELEEATR